MNRMVLLTLNLLGLMVLTGCSQAVPNQKPALASQNTKSGNPKTLEQTIDAVVQASLKEEHIPGAAVVVVQNGQTIFKQGYGVSDVRTGTPIDADTTIMRIGSVTKPLTAWAVTRLADQGRISLDDDAADYFPALNKAPNISGSAAKVTVRNLITHTGGFDQIGIGRHIWELEKSLDERLEMRPTVSEFLDGNLRRVSPSGAYYRYDTYGITLAGAVLENVTGRPYAEAMNEVLFKPAGMKNTHVALAAESRKHLAVGHGYIEGELHPAPYEVYVTQPASSIDATPADMGRLLESVTGDGTTKAGRLYSEKTVRAMLAPQFRPHPDFAGVTHGMNEYLATDGFNLRSIGHGGSMLGFQTSFTVIPELKLGIFVSANRNREAGGESVQLNGKVQEAVIKIFHQGEPFTVKDTLSKETNQDLEEYVGYYYFGVFCHSCTTEEFEQGGWPRSNPTTISLTDNALSIRDTLYRMSTEADVFVSEDRTQKIHFARDPNGEIIAFSFVSSPDVLERGPDPQ